MDKPRYQTGQLIIVYPTSQDLIVGVIVGAKWDEKISEWNMKCGPGYENPSENQQMWLYAINAIGRKKIAHIYEDDIEGVIKIDAR